MSTIVGKGIISAGGGGELNIAYGLTPPTDTSKLWVRIANKPDNVEAKAIIQFGNETLTGTDIMLPTPPNGSSTRFYPVNLVYCNGYYYCTGTYSPTGSTSSDHTLQKLYRLSNGTWTEVAAFEFGNEHYLCATAVVGNKIYFVGGHTYTGDSANSYRISTNDYSNQGVAVYNTESNTLIEYPNILPNKSTQVICTAVVGSRIYLFGGNYASTSTTGQAMGGQSIVRFIDTSLPELVVSDAGDLLIGDPNTIVSNRGGYSSAVVGTDVYLLAGNAITLYSNTTTAINPSYVMSVYHTTTETCERLNITHTLRERSVVPMFCCCGWSFGKYVYFLGGRKRDESCTTSPQSSLKIRQPFSDLAEEKVWRYDIEQKVLVQLDTHVTATQFNTVPFASNVLVAGASATGGNVVYKFAGKSELAENHLLIQEDLFGNEWSAIKSKDVNFIIGVQAVYLGNTNGYADEVDAYLYDSTENQWKKLDGTGYVADALKALSVLGVQ